MGKTFGMVEENTQNQVRLVEGKEEMEAENEDGMRFFCGEDVLK